MDRIFSVVLFPAPPFADEPEYFALFDGETYPFERLHPSVVLLEVQNFNQGHSEPPPDFVERNAEGRQNQPEKEKAPDSGITADYCDPPHPPARKGDPGVAVI